jgi:hypothetical protein
VRIRSVGPLLAALFLAACSNEHAFLPIVHDADLSPAVSNADPPPVVRPPALPPARAGASWGIDLASNTNPFLDQLRHGRIQFVARYYRDPSSRLPRLTATEAQHLSALGLKIVAVWESYSDNPAYFSYARGYWDAAKSALEAVATGQPAGTAIYFGVDFNAQGWQLAAVEQYFRGIDAGMAAVGRGQPPYRIGVYGSGAVCRLIKGSGLAQFAWLANSTLWAGDRTYRNWNIRQGTRFATLSFNHDADEAWGQYGAFQVAVDPTPAVPVFAAAGRASTPAAAPELGWMTAALDPRLRR